MFLEELKINCFIGVRNFPLSVEQKSKISLHWCFFANLFIAFKYSDGITLN